MPFNGKNSSAHFLHLETTAGMYAQAASLYTSFISAVRACNLKGNNCIRALFPDEYSEISLKESSLSNSARLFVTRKCAEVSMWKKRGSILEIGVASASHAIELISNTNACSYLGVDLSFNAINDSTKKRLDLLAANCKIYLCNGDSVKVLRELLVANKRFDSIYIDASHWHSFVSEELSICSQLIADGGRIVLNDYLDWFISSMEPCGVKRAVNEFVENNIDWSIDYYVINDCDISLIRKYHLESQKNV